MTHSGRVWTFLVALFLASAAAQAVYFEGPREPRIAKYAVPLPPSDHPVNPNNPKKHTVYVNQIENNYYGTRRKPADYLSDLHKLGEVPGKFVEDVFGHFHGLAMPNHGPTFNIDITTSETLANAGTTNDHETTDGSGTAQDVGSHLENLATTDSSGTTIQSETTESSAMAVPETTAGFEFTTSATGEGVTRSNRALPGRLNHHRPKGIRPMQFHQHSPRSVDGRGGPGPKASERRVVYPVQQYRGNNVDNKNVYNVQQRNNLAGASRNFYPLQSNRNVDPVRQHRNVKPSKQNSNAAPARAVRNPTPNLQRKETNPPATMTRNFATHNIHPKRPNRNTKLAKPTVQNNKPVIERQNRETPSKSPDSTDLNLDPDEYMRILTKLLKEQPQTKTESSKRRRSVGALLHVLDQYFTGRAGAPVVMTPAEQLLSCLNKMNVEFQAWLALLNVASLVPSANTTPEPYDLPGIMIKDQQDFQRLYELFEQLLNTTSVPTRMAESTQMSAMGSIIRLATRLLQRKQKELNDLVRPTPEERRKNKSILDHLRSITKIAKEYLAAEERDRPNRQSDPVDGNGERPGYIPLLWQSGTFPNYAPSIESLLKIAERIISNDPNIMHNYEQTLSNIRKLFNLILEQESRNPVLVVPPIEGGVGRQREVTLTVSYDRDRDREITIDELIRLLNQGRRISVRFEDRHRQRGHGEGRFDDVEDDTMYYDYEYDEDTTPDQTTSATNISPRRDIEG